MVLPGLGRCWAGSARRTEPARLLALGVGTLLVGFSEELLTRGTGLVGLRGGFGEALSWFFSCLIFGLIHALNVFFGQSLGSTVQQIVFAFLAGTVFYLTRRVSGTLIVCMVLHAWIDFTTFAFADAATDAESPFLILGFAQWAAFILAIVGVIVVLRRGTAQQNEVATEAACRLLSTATGSEPKALPPYNLEPYHRGHGRSTEQQGATVRALVVFHRAGARSLARCRGDAGPVAHRRPRHARDAARAP